MSKVRLILKSNVLDANGALIEEKMATLDIDCAELEDKLTGLGVPYHFARNYSVVGAEVLDPEGAYARKMKRVDDEAMKDLESRTTPLF